MARRSRSKRAERAARRGSAERKKLHRTKERKKNKALMAATATAVEKDVAIQTTTMSQVKNVDDDMQRKDQRVAKILQKKEDLTLQYKQGRIDKTQLDFMLAAYIEMLADEEKEKKNDVILIGEQVKPSARGQIITKFDPYTLEDSQVEDVGQQPEKGNVIFFKVR